MHLLGSEAVLTSKCKLIFAICQYRTTCTANFLSLFRSASRFASTPFFRQTADRTIPRQKCLEPYRREATWRRFLRMFPRSGLRYGHEPWRPLAGSPCEIAVNRPHYWWRRHGKFGRLIASTCLPLEVRIVPQSPRIKHGRLASREDGHDKPWSCTRQHVSPLRFFVKQWVHPFSL